MKHRNKAIIRAAQGAMAAFGAPLGWLAIQWYQGIDLIAELNNHTGLYSYMLFGTIATFSAFGWYLGKKEQHFTTLSIRDSLTSLFNLRFFKERLEEEVYKAQRNHAPLCMISFDLDFFKQVNDNYGHSAGDEVLKQVSKITTNTIRKHEVVARVGGEEFSILLPGSTLESAITTGERLRKRIELADIKLKNKDNIQVTVSVGITQLNSSDDFNKFYERVDKALYQAKNNGRNRVETI